MTFLVHTLATLSAVNTGVVVALAPGLVEHVSAVAFMLALSLVYLGLLQLAGAISDPFGDDAIDFPAAAMQRQCWRTLESTNRLLRPNSLLDSEIDGMLTSGCPAHLEADDHTASDGVNFEVDVNDGDE